MRFLSDIDAVDNMEDPLHFGHVNSRTLSSKFDTNHLTLSLKFQMSNVVFFLENTTCGLHVEINILFIFTTFISGI